MIPLWCKAYVINSKKEIMKGDQVPSSISVSHSCLSAEWKMSVSRPRATDLLSAYDLSLEQQIAGRGSSLVCQDKELWMQVEVLLREGDAQETHCLGLEPLRLMEESLKAAASGGRAKARGGLRGLAKAFEVVEQAALNLYLGPWREEYKVVKVSWQCWNDGVMCTISDFSFNQEIFFTVMVTHNVGQFPVFIIVI